MKAFTQLFAATALCLPLMGACAAHDATQEQDSIEQDGDTLPGEVITQLTLEEGVTINFYAEEPFGVVVDALAAPGRVLPDAIYAGLGAVELYESLAGHAAPAQLVEASEFALEMAELYDEPEVDSADEVVEGQITADPASNLEGAGVNAPGAVAHSGNHTGSEWIAGHCSTDSAYWDYTACKTYRVCANGASSCALYSKNGTSAYGTVNPYRGNVRLKLYRKNTWGVWKLIESRAVPEGYTAYVADTIIWKRGQKITLSEASGDGFHYSISAYF
jgi:hypothetical protein